MNHLHPVCGSLRKSWDFWTAFWQRDGKDGNFAEEFHGKIFRDNEIAFVYVYQQPVDIETLVLQKEEVESVRWFDLEETYQNCRNRNTQFCAPVPGLEVVRQYLYS